jgi:hypothetical protein
MVSRQAEFFSLFSFQGVLVPSFHGQCAFLQWVVAGWILSFAEGLVRVAFWTAIKFNLIDDVLQVTLRAGKGRER